MAKNVHSMDMSAVEQLRSMQQCLLLQLDIISGKVDAVIAAMSNCRMTIQPTPSGALATSKDIHERQAPCVTPTTLHEKVTLGFILLVNSRFNLVSY